MVRYVEIIPNPYDNHSMSCLRNTVIFKFVEVWRQSIASFAEFCQNFCEGLSFIGIS